MFVAIDDKGTVVVTAQSKGQAFRLLVQQGRQPENYEIKQKGSEMRCPYCGRRIFKDEDSGKKRCWSCEVNHSKK